MKKKFDVPLVFLTGATPGDGGGSNEGGFSIKPIPVKFDEWMQSRWLGDYDQNDAVDFSDYAKWWAQNGFGPDTWSQYNPSVAWKDDWMM
ncbi:MAG: hypothetical protein IJK35_00175 [Oscillospiraceae bacterium]|nr:hypothetical protein [Oscillospiraceae bacterium]